MLTFFLFKGQRITILRNLFQEWFLLINRNVPAICKLYLIPCPVHLSTAITDPHSFRSAILVTPYQDLHFLSRARSQFHPTPLSPHTLTYTDDERTHGWWWVASSFPSPTTTDISPDTTRNGRQSIDKEIDAVE